MIMINLKLWGFCNVWSIKFIHIYIPLIEVSDGFPIIKISTSYLMTLIQLQNNNSKHSLMNEQKEQLNLGFHILCTKVELGPWSLPA